MARVAGWAYISPSIAGATTTGARGREAGGGDGVAGEAGRHRRQPVGGRRGDDDRVGAVGDDDVADPLVGEQAADVALDRVAGQGRERQLADEAGRGRGHQDDDVGALVAQAADEVGGLVGGDRAGDADGDQAAGEASVGGRSRVSASRRSPSSSGCAAADLGVEDREALEGQVGVDRVDALEGPGPRRRRQAAGQDRLDGAGSIPAASASSRRIRAISPSARAW